MDTFGGDPGAWIDQDGDGVTETWIGDTDGDGVADTQYVDANLDGVADIAQYDINGDGLADIQYVDENHDGVADRALFDTDGDGVFDAEAAAPAPAGGIPGAAGPFPDPAASGGVPPATTPTLDPGTAALLDSINTGMTDVHTLYQGTVDPGSVSSDDLAAAEERLFDTGRNTLFLEGLNAADQIRNDVTRDTLERQWSEQALNDAAQAERDAARAENESDWAVWESKRDRGL